MTTRFKNAIDALVKAFFKGTLAKGNCSACAVGNICAAALKAEVTNDHLPSIFTATRNGCAVDNHSWKSLFFTDQDGKQHIAPFPSQHPYALMIVENTGYSVEELAKVESAFEKHTKIHLHRYRDISKEEIMQDQYNGLMAVVEILCEIEGIEDPAEYKQLFEIPA